MGEPALDYSKRYTYEEYLEWNDDQRWELIDGVPFCMSPAPTFYHQEIVAWFTGELRQFFRQKPCRVAVGPDVTLPKTIEIEPHKINGDHHSSAELSGKEPSSEVSSGQEPSGTVVRPDLVVVCDEKKIGPHGVHGAPDLALEVLSKSTIDRDLGLKLRLYELNGVHAYLIVDPWGRMVLARYLNDCGQYNTPVAHDDRSVMPVDIFEGLTIDLRELPHEVQ